MHRVLKFNQSPWLKHYIDFNTHKRTQEKNSFQKDFFKRKRVDVRLVTSKTQLKKAAAKPTYVSSKIFNENLAAVHKIKRNTNLKQGGICRYVYFGF